MSWGFSIWGVHVWGGGPTTDNLSFEDADPFSQGKADQWETDSLSAEEGIAIFDIFRSPGSTWGTGSWGIHVWGGLGIGYWDPWEDYEELWQMPFLVHMVEDVSNGITAPDASDQPTAITLAIEAALKYQDHLSSLEVHGALDLTNLAAALVPTNYDELAVAVMLLKYAFNAHLWEWPDVHRKWDNVNAVTAPDLSLAPPNPAELPQLITMLNEFKVDFNAHLVTTGYGATTSDALFEFLSTHLSQGIFVPDLLAESYERLWSIRDMFPDPEVQTQVSVDGPPNWTIVVNSVPDDGDTFILDDGRGNGPLTFEFTTDGTVGDGYVPVDITGFTLVSQVRAEMQAVIASTDLAFTLASPAGDTLELYMEDGGPVAGDMVDEGSAFNHLTSWVLAASWPGGHEEFKDVFEYLVSALGIVESFDQQWYLPGTPGYWANHIFTSRYKDVEEGWRYLENQVIKGITETFESEWKNNDVGFAKYWSGSAWRFLADHIKTMAIGEYMFAMYDAGSSTEVINAGVSPHYSPDLYLLVTTALHDYAMLFVDFEDKDGVAQFCYFHMDDPDDLPAGTIVTDIGLTSIIADPRYEFEEQFNGITRITNLSVLFTTPEGAVEWWGTKYVAETFEEGWTLTLT